MIKLLKRLISYLTKKPIYIEDNISCGDMVISNSGNSNFINEIINKQIIQYILRPNIGPFMLISTTKNKMNTTVYRLEHIMTGEVFNISENMFNLLFINKNLIQTETKDLHET